jgi:DNA recombination protein RmuC
VIVLVGAVSFLLGALLVYFWRGARIAELSVQLFSTRADKEKLFNELSETRKSIADASDIKSRLEETTNIVRKFKEGADKIEGNLKQMIDVGQQVRMSANTIEKVFSSSSGVRGSLGEMLLQTLLEENGLVRGEHFDAQFSLMDQGQNEGRPDFVVKLPHGRRLVIDSKDVTSEYFLAVDSPEVAQQKMHIQKLVQNIRGNVQRLSRKEYQELLDPEIPFVVMYISNEGALHAALTADPGLFHEAYTKYKVFLASPMTIIPLVQLIQYGWQQKQFADNARDLHTIVEQLGNRLAVFVGHLNMIGGGIQKASEAWNAAIASWKKNLSPQLGKIKQMGGKLKEFEEPEEIEADFSRIALPKDSDLLE